MYFILLFLVGFFSPISVLCKGIRWPTKCRISINNIYIRPIILHDPVGKVTVGYQEIKDGSQHERWRLVLGYGWRGDGSTTVSIARIQGWGLRLYQYPCITAALSWADLVSDRATANPASNICIYTSHLSGTRPPRL